MKLSFSVVLVLQMPDIDPYTRRLLFEVKATTQNGKFCAWLGIKESSTRSISISLISLNLEVHKSHHGVL